MAGQQAGAMASHPWTLLGGAAEEGKQFTGSEPNMQAIIGAMILAAGLGLASVSNAGQSG